MEDTARQIFEVKFNTKTFDIITANSSFYVFLGNRLYYTIDRLVYEADREWFVKKVNECYYDKCFAIRIMINDDEYFESVVKLVATEQKDAAIIQFADITALFEEYKNLLMDNKEKNHIISMLDGLFFSFDKESDEFVVYSVAPRKLVVKSGKITEIFDVDNPLVPEDVRGQISNVFSDIRNGARRFKHRINGTGLFGNENNSELLLMGTGVYVDGKHVKTVGSIIYSDGSELNNNFRYDQLTGLIMKEDITNFAKKVIDVNRQFAYIAIIDIDDFKSVNDNFGHMKGDEVLRNCAAIVSEAVGKFGYAGRIGGDEFFIVLTKAYDEEAVRSILRSIKNGVLSAYSDEVDGFHVSTSMGCSCFPNDSDNFNDLFMLADFLLYRAKSKGKNRYIIYNFEKHGKVEDILKSGMEDIGLASRKGISKSEIVCQWCDKVLSGSEVSEKQVFNDIVNYFGVERVVLYSQEGELLKQVGNKLIKKQISLETSDYIVDENLKMMYDKGVLVVNNIKSFQNKNPEVFEKLKKQGVLSFMHHEFTGESGKKYVVSYESVVIKSTWNMEDMHFFRIFNFILSKCL